MFVNRNRCGRAECAHHKNSLVGNATSNRLAESRIGARKTNSRFDHRNVFRAQQELCAVEVGSARHHG